MRNYRVIVKKRGKENDDECNASVCWTGYDSCYDLCSHGYHLWSSGLRKEDTEMVINAILLGVGLVMIPAAICAHTEATCGAEA